MKLSGMMIFAICLLATSATAEGEKQPTPMNDGKLVWQAPPEGVVRDPHAAITIARAMWLSMHPELVAVIADEKTWQKTMVATLKDGVWTVSELMKPGEIGGGGVFLIAKKDGRVLDIYLEQ